jgi:hypothetical protein
MPWRRHALRGVIPALPAPAKAGVAGIHLTRCADVRGWLDAGDKPRHDKVC